MKNINKNNVELIDKFILKVFFKKFGVPSSSDEYLQ